MTRTRNPRTTDQKAKDAASAKARRLIKKQKVDKALARRQAVARNQRNYSARKQGINGIVMSTSFTSVDQRGETPSIEKNPSMPAFRHQVSATPIARGTTQFLESVQFRLRLVGGESEKCPVHVGASRNKCRLVRYRMPQLRTLSKLLSTSSRLLSTSSLCRT